MRALASFVFVASLAGPALADDAPSPVPTSMAPDGTPSPVPTTMPEGGAAPKANTFDADGARTVLAAIDYKDCGTGGAAKLHVTFASSGAVERVSVVEGALEADVAICITRRFMKASVAPFEGAPRTVKWSIQLGGTSVYAKSAPTYAASPGYPPPYAQPAYPIYSPEVIEAGDRERPPAGYRVEERRRTGPLIAGAVVGGMGLAFGAMALEDGRSDNSGLMIVSVIHLAVGLPLLLVGFSTKRVFVLDTPRVSVAPVVTRHGGSIGLSVQF